MAAAGFELESSGDEPHELARATTFQFAPEVRQASRPFLRSVFEHAGLREVPALEPGRRATASLLWANMTPSPNTWPTDSTRVCMVNHLPRPVGIHLTHKRYLYESVQRAKERDPAAYDFLPEAHILPLPEPELAALFSSLHERDTVPFVQKPVNASRGDGFSLVSSPAQVQNTSRFLLQRYLDNLDLIEGCKYHMRLYVLVTAIKPLRAYVHRDGYVKRALLPYTRPSLHTPLSLDDTYNVHVTNHRDGNVYASDPFMHTTAFYAHLAARGIDVGAVRARICTVLALTLRAVEAEMVQDEPRGSMLSHSFELFGADLLFDEHVRPWLMEMNLSPSLDVESSAVLETIKRRVLEDTVRIAVTQPATASQTTAASARAAAELENLGDFIPLF